MPRANIVALAARANPGNTGGDDDGLNGLKPRRPTLCRSREGASVVWLSDRVTAIPAGLRRFTPGGETGVGFTGRERE